MDLKPSILSPESSKSKNKYDFLNLSNFSLEWRVEADGIKVAEGKLPELNVPAHEKRSISVPFNLKPESGKEYFIIFSAKTITGTDLIPSGHEVAYDQFKLPLQSMAKGVVSKGKLTLTKNTGSVLVKGG